MTEIMYRDNAVVFLDIDGVLIHDLQVRRHFEDPIEFVSNMDPKCVSRLIELQQKYRFKLVLSSSMRKNYKTIEEFQTKYANVGADKLVFHKNWRTTSHPKVHPGSERSLKKWTTAMGVEESVESTIHWRGHEIKEWLEANPEVTNYLSLDDSPDFYPLEEEQCCRIRYGLAEGGLAHARQDWVDNAFEHNFGEEAMTVNESVLDDAQKKVHGSQMLEQLMGDFTATETWVNDYIQFQNGVQILMRGYENITPDEMQLLKELAHKSPAFLMVVAGHYNFKINFQPINETE